MSFQIETERLILRDVQEDDIPILIKQFAEPESRSNILSFQADEDHNRKDLENAMAWAKIERREHYKLSVVRKDDQTLIGSGTITYVRPEAFNTTIGWHYGHEFRGKGYATEAARALLYIGFSLNDVTEIFADCFVENKASIKIMGKIGMSSSWNLGLFNALRGWSYGENKPTVRYIISRNQWVAGRKSNSTIESKVFEP
jgi:RimJ/RimL family protein N-acetyltransferase